MKCPIRTYYVPARKIGDTTVFASSGCNESDKVKDASLNTQPGYVDRYFGPKYKPLKVAIDADGEYHIIEKKEPEKFAYAVDWGGTFNVNPEIQEMCRALLNRHHKVYIISVAWAHENRQAHVEAWCEIHDCYFSGIHIIEETGNTQHGEEKVKIMKELGCRVMIDDNQDVINHVRDAGLVALKVPYKDH
jgi:hypothetical protein